MNVSPWLLAVLATLGAALALAARTGEGTPTGQGQDDEPTVVPPSEVQDRTKARHVGIRVVFRPESRQRGIRANLIYSGLLSLGEVLRFHPNFVVATDEELARFDVVLRTTAQWEDIREAVLHEGHADVAEVEAIDPGLVPDPSASTGAEPPLGREAGAPEEVGRALAEGAGEERLRAGADTIRVPLERLDELSGVVGELVVERALLDTLIRHLGEVADSPNTRRLAAELRDLGNRLAGLSSRLAELAMELRMVPVGTLFRRFPRLVRDLERATGKELRLVLAGEDTLLDKAVVEAIADPLLHLVRNAADHGIEGREERLRAGKPAAGTIALRAYERGDRVVVEVSDDGRGIDPDGVRQKAVTRGILDAKRAAELHPEEVVELLFAPGFSTADRVTEISGRGVGLDVVKAHVERLRGKVTVTTRPGEGTTFSLQLPLTLAVMPVFLAEVAGEVLAVPVDRVVALLRIRQEDLAVWGTVLRLPDRVLPLLDLGKRFWGTETAGEYALVVSDEAGEFAFPIAQSLGLRDVVVKRMSRFVGEVSGIAGCAVLGDGRVALVLDPTELSGGERAEGSRRSAPRRAS